MKFKKMMLGTAAIGTLAAVLLIASVPQAKSQELPPKQNAQMSKNICKESLISTIDQALASNLILCRLFPGWSQKSPGLSLDSQEPPDDPPVDSQSPCLNVWSWEGREVGLIQKEKVGVQ